MLDRILLIGFMGAGKSSVGAALAERLSYDYIDLDQQIEQVAGESIASIFSTKGESHFRKLEAEALSNALPKQRVVIAAGGGLVENEQAKRILQGKEVVRVYLSASLREIEARIGTGTSTSTSTSSSSSSSSSLNTSRERPLFGRRKELFEQRLPLYEKMANYKVETSSRSVNQVVQEILEQVTSAG